MKRLINDPINPINKTPFEIYPYLGLRNVQNPSSDSPRWIFLLSGIGLALYYFKRR